MEATCIADNLKYLAENGVTLSIDERMHLELALVQVQEKLKYEELQFWGKISGKGLQLRKLIFHNACNLFIFKQALRTIILWPLESTISANVTFLSVSSSGALTPPGNFRCYLAPTMIFAASLTRFRLISSANMSVSQSTLEVSRPSCTLSETTLLPRSQLPNLTD